MQAVFTLGSLLLVQAAWAELPTADFILNTYKVSGFSSALYTKDGEQFKVEGGRRMINDPTPIESTDRWQLAESSRIISVLMVARLADQGKINMDLPIKDQVSFELDPGFDNLHLVDLLVYQGGMETETETMLNNYPLVERLMAESNWDPAFNQTAARFELADYYLTQPPNSGLKDYQSSFLSFNIAIAVIESITGMSWEQMVQDEVFTPLGMEGCGFGPNTLDPSLPPKQPWSHLAGAFGIYHLPITPGPQSESPSVFLPSNGINCDMESFGKVMVAYLKQSEDYLNPGTWATITNAIDFDVVGAGMMIVDAGEGIGKLGLVETGISHKNSNLNYGSLYILFDLGFALVQRANQPSVPGMRANAGMEYLRTKMFEEVYNPLPAGLAKLL